MIADRVISGLSAIPDHDLMLCLDRGIAYQADMQQSVFYDQDYFDKCAANDASAIAGEINEARISLVRRHIGGNRVCDIGIGGGGFLRARANTWGYDVNPRAAAWLAARGLLAMRLEDFSALTMWDVIEHLPQPEVYLDKIPLGGFLFCSLPIFANLSEIRWSKHYRPGEHLLYFTRGGFVDYMAGQGFLMLEHNDDETKAGRESIESFAFRRNRNLH